ncbi:MAG: tetratricopeptide repeat protein [Campylobacteraceae bacterium]|nr:tetratricopeptide repeat protein [Campylobacteraceae bacterium]
MLVTILHIYEKQGKYDKALEFYKKALQLYTIKFGKGISGIFDISGEDDDPESIQIRGNIKAVSDKRRKGNEALEQYLKAYRNFKSTLGKSHPYTIRVKDNIKTIYQKTGDQKPFDEWLEERLDQWLD